MQKPETWQTEYAIETSAAPETIWRIWRDVPGWKNWNAGIEAIELHGPFALGTTFTMTPPGQAPLTSQLIEVRENEIFVDETRVEDLIVRVAHKIEQTTSGGTRIVYAIEAVGVGSSEIGPMVSADFPDVLQALARLAETSKAF